MGNLNSVTVEGLPLDPQDWGPNHLACLADAMFHVYDSNGDGFVDATEMASWAENKT